MSGLGFDPDLYAAVDEFFARTVDQQLVAAAERNGYPADLWSRTTELGFPLVGVDEARGGSGGSILDALAIAVLAGKYAVPLPVVETHLAASLLSGSGLDVTSDPMAVAPGTARDELTVRGSTADGVLHDVAWARDARCIVAVLDDGLLLSLDPARCQIDAGSDLAGQPRDVVHFEQAECLPAGAGCTPRALQLRGALLRAGQLAGAMEAVAEITVTYCGERHQFGRPLQAFQAVQQHLVALAQAAQLSRMSVLRAGLAASDREASFEICSAKLVADECAADAVRATHQAHGAISMTLEYRVQLLTRRLNAWRWEFGNETDLARDIGEAVAGTGSFFATVAAERESPEVIMCPAP